MNIFYILTINPSTVVDPGFPRGGGANSSRGGGAPTYDFAKFSQKSPQVPLPKIRGRD